MDTHRSTACPNLVHISRSKKIPERKVKDNRMDTLYIVCAGLLFFFFVGVVVAGVSEMFD